MGIGRRAQALVSPGAKLAGIHVVIILELSATQIAPFGILRFDLSHRSGVNGSNDRCGSFACGFGHYRMGTLAGGFQERRGMELKMAFAVCQS